MCLNQINIDKVYKVHKIFLIEIKHFLKQFLFNSIFNKYFFIFLKLSIFLSQIFIF
jgi:hypothetical protein